MIPDRRRFALVVFAVCVAAALLAAAARPAFTPSWSYVPDSIRAGLSARLGGTLYLPARTPPFYRYRAGATVAAGVLSVRFENRVRVRQRLWRWTAQTFLWQVRPLRAGVSCAAWGNAQKTLQVDGNKVFWAGDAAGGKAWRCATDRRGRTHLLIASHGDQLPDVALAIVVASALDVAALNV